MAQPGKRRSTLGPTPFARHLGSYLWSLVRAENGDRSGRWLAARTDRSNGYWEKILNLRQAMTTNDIAIVAELFGVSPYQFVHEAREWDGEAQERSHAPVVPLASKNVGGSTHTEEHQDREPRVAFRDDSGSGELIDE